MAYSSVGRTSLEAVSLTSGVRGPRYILTMAKTFDHFVVMSVICFAEDNSESDFTGIIRSFTENLMCTWPFSRRVYIR